LNYFDQFPELGVSGIIYGTAHSVALLSDGGLHVFGRDVEKKDHFLENFRFQLPKPPFSSLMPGLMSKFITGTPMAPLSGVGLMYIGESSLLPLFSLPPFSLPSSSLLFWTPVFRWIFLGKTRPGIGIFLLSDGSYLSYCANVVFVGCLINYLSSLLSPPLPPPAPPPIPAEPIRVESPFFE
jgi:hypothetical protein